MRTRTYVVEHADDSAGLTWVKLACLDDDAQGQLLEVIWQLELDAEVIDEHAWRTIGQRGFDQPRYFSAYVHALRWNCVTATDPKLFQSPFRAGIRIDAYQLEPLRKALLLPRVNLFIADDVGLGKTIEAGLIAVELLLRRRVREIVVACPPSMIPQWRDELEARFGLTFEVLDRKYIERVREERGYGVNPWATFPRFLVSHKLLIDETYAGPLRAWLDNLRPGSLLILDEAHHAAPSSGTRYAIDSRITRAVRDIAPRFEHRLFLSATPHNGHSNSFSALLEILDPQRFTRGVRVLKSQLDPVMVRRLKEDIRQVAGGLPRREVRQVDLSGLPDDAPELRLSKLLDRYSAVRQRRLEGASKRKQAEAALLISGLQQRLLSSIEAFARTLAVHRRTMEKVWADPTVAQPAPETSRADADLLFDTPDGDDDRAQLSETDLAELEAGQVAAVTAATAGNSSAADTVAEKALLAEMETVAEQSRGRADARVRYLLGWIRDKMCAGVRVPSGPSPADGAAWTDLRLLIFTQYEDTKRYLVEILRSAMADTHLAEYRVEVFHGPTPPDKREAIKRAFNASPREHPVRILVATDAAREGLNLQAHCHNLFHFDVPWNPSRLEQRNGRIDRKLQPSPTVYCHYFVYTQRPEDRVLQVLVEKTQRIQEELGSLSRVLEARLSEMLRGGIRHADVANLASQIGSAETDAAKRQTTEDELEVSRERREALQDQIDVLRNRINAARRWIGLDDAQFRDAISCSLEMLGVAPLTPVAGPAGSPARYVLPNLDTRHGSDPTWATTLDTLRASPVDGVRNYEWRNQSPVRPVVFDPPQGVDDDVVQLHLEHRLTQRLLSRFLSQGFVHHDLSRACLANTADAIPRVVLLGRLSVYGPGAARLHEEILTVTARWVDPRTRREPLQPYARDAESKTLELLEDSLRPGALSQIASAIGEQLLAAVPTDVGQLLPHLESRGREAMVDAEAKLAERGRVESEAMRRVLEEQRGRILKQLDRTTDESQLQLFSADERKQFSSDRRYWQRWIENVDGDLAREPARILDFYRTVSSRIEPIGLAYLWPVTG
jgi:superfamily II DNA or RNA helicase